VLVELGNSIRKGMHGIQSTAINDRFTLRLSPLPQMVVDDFRRAWAYSKNRPASETPSFH
jgi:hypothetical protein